MRLDKYLAENGFSSRTKAARAIEKGLVTLNGRTAKASDEVAEGDRVEVRAEEVGFASEGGQKLYKALRAHDEYLWKYRDPAGTGCLQSWCVWDTGEDNGVRFGKADDSWSGETPPCFERMPFYSMDVMSYSYDGRKTLARISELLGNGEEAMWREKAEYVRRRLREYLDA